MDNQRETNIRLDC